MPKCAQCDSEAALRAQHREFQRMFRQRGECGEILHVQYVNYFCTRPLKHRGNHRHPQATWSSRRVRVRI